MRRQRLRALAAVTCVVASWAAAAVAVGDDFAPAFTNPRGVIDASPDTEWPRDFDAAAYLAYNLDVAKQVPQGAGPEERAAAAWAHYRRSGFKEGRIYTRIPVVLG
jgi:hypothetical protein